jgi:hypothetical protein
MLAIEIKEPVHPGDRGTGNSMTPRDEGKVCFFFQMLQGMNKGVFRDGIIILLAQLFLMAGLVLAGKEVILDPLLQIVLLFYASYTGWAIFEKERQEGAVEYMLSLPVSRTRLFFVKFMPRAIMILIVLAFYLLLRHLFDFPFVLETLSFSLTYVVFFFVSLAFSLSIKSFITAFLLTALLSLGQGFFIKMLDRTLPDSEALLRANLTILVFPLLFFVLFQGYDIKPLSYFNRKYAPPALFLSILIALFAFFTTGETWNNHILNKSGSTIRFKCKKSEILQQQEKEIKRFKYKGCVFPLYEVEENFFLYAVKREPGRNGCPLSALIIIDLKSGKEKRLFDIPEGWDLVGLFPGKVGKLIDGTYYLVLQSRERQLQMIMAVTGKKVKQIPISGNLSNQYIVEFFHAARSSRQFFMLTKDSMVYRVDESGAAEELFYAEALAPWKDKLLVFDRSGMTLYKISGEAGLTPVYRQEGRIKKILRHWGTHETRLVIFKNGKEFFMLDLEKEEEPININLTFPPFYYLALGEKYILLHRQPQEIIISEIQKGKIIEKKRWQPRVEFEYEQIYVSPYGIMVYNEKEYEVYPFKK